MNPMATKASEADVSGRELLELAAKAAGLGKLQNEPYSLGGTRYFYREDDYPSGTTWNPLTDDGDALRLAVKLRISVAFWDEDVSALLPPINRELPEAYGSDPCAATRRAITRAAAALAKFTQEKP